MILYYACFGLLLADNFCVPAGILFLTNPIVFAIHLSGTLLLQFHLFDFPIDPL